MTAAVQAQIDVATRAAAAPAAAREARQRPQSAPVREVPAAKLSGVPGADLGVGCETPKEQQRPPGHRARYALAQGGGLPYAGCRLVFDDVTPAQAQSIIQAAQAGGVKPY